jgi:hypothetical protein
LPGKGQFIAEPPFVSLHSVERTTSLRPLAYSLSYKNLEACEKRDNTLLAQLAHLCFQELFDLLNGRIRRFLDGSLRSATRRLDLLACLLPD